MVGWLVDREQEIVVGFEGRGPKNRTKYGGVDSQREQARYPRGSLEAGFGRCGEWFWEMRDGMRCTIVRAHGEKREKESHNPSKKRLFLQKKKLACPCHQDNPSTLPHCWVPSSPSPSQQTQGFPKTRGWGASTQAHHISSPNSQPPRVRVRARARARARVHRHAVVQTLDGPCFATFRSNPLGQSSPRRVIRPCGCCRSHRVQPSGVSVFV